MKHRMLTETTELADCIRIAPLENPPFLNCSDCFETQSYAMATDMSNNTNKLLYLRDRSRKVQPRNVQKKNEADHNCKATTEQNSRISGITMPLRAVEKWKQKRQKLKEDAKCEQHEARRQIQKQSSEKRKPLQNLLSRSKKAKLQKQSSEKRKPLQNLLSRSKKAKLKIISKKKERKPNKSGQTHNTKDQIVSVNESTAYKTASLAKAVAHISRQLPEYLCQKKAIVRKVFEANIDFVMGSTTEMHQIITEATVISQRYYRSGLEMVRMANVYLEEGSLENAFILYMKFMTLFLEKIRQHPDFPTVSVTDRATNAQKLREVLPKAEKLKTKLLEQYHAEYQKCMEEKELLERLERERRQREEGEEEEVRGEEEEVRGEEEEEDDEEDDDDEDEDDDEEEEGEKETELELQDVPIPKENGTCTVSPPPLVVVPNVPTDDITYPNTFDVQQPTVPQKPDSLSIPDTWPSPTPSVDRSTKPASLLSPSLHSKVGLRDVIVPSKLMSKFMNLAQRNTLLNIETCGILAGKLNHDQLIITHLLVPKQNGTADSCTTQNEEEIFDYQDQHDLITLGWIHTHPSQTAFLSSVDLHTHCSYQLMMPEAIAIVCAPKYNENGFFILTPHYGLDFIANCRQTGFHPHPIEPPLFMKAEHSKLDNNAYVEVVDLRR